MSLIPKITSLDSFNEERDAFCLRHDIPPPTANLLLLDALINNEHLSLPLHPRIKCLRIYPLFGSWFSNESFCAIHLISPPFERYRLVCLQPISQKQFLTICAEWPEGTVQDIIHSIYAV
jgi:hypothetical protein